MTTLEAMKKLNEDEALANKVKAEVKTPEGLYEVLQTIGLTDSFETFKDAALECNESITRLSPEELEAVAGGDDTITTLTTTTTASIAAAAAI